MAIKVAHLRGKGSTPETTKEWISIASDDSVTVFFGRTGDRIQPRDVIIKHGLSPFDEMVSRRDKKLRSLRYWEVKNEALPEEVEDFLRILRDKEQARALAGMAVKDKPQEESPKTTLLEDAEALDYLTTPDTTRAWII
ncbi:MAG: hypothetical protein KKB70_06230 [Proteobacteria bacterium]|nr:hypothetical protein [Pseudomonadota bacterium]